MLFLEFGEAARLEVLGIVEADGGVEELVDYFGSDGCLVYPIRRHGRIHGVDGVLRVATRHQRISLHVFYEVVGIHDLSTAPLLAHQVVPDPVVILFI